MKNGNESAYPTEKLIDGGHPMLGDVKVKTTGLTKREYFAGLAIVSCSMVGMSDSEIKEYAKNAVRLADEILKQLENETTK